MPDASFPGAGQPGGEEPPLPGGPARDGAGDDDWDGDAEMAAYLADIEAGRLAEPGLRESPGWTVSLGEAGDVDPAELAVLMGAGGSTGPRPLPGRSSRLMSRHFPRWRWRARPRGSAERRPPSTTGPTRHA